MKWTFIVDTRELALEDTVTAEGTIKLDDTIARGDAAERDVSEDANQYEVRAISLTPKNLDQTEYPQRDGVEASFSLDNVDDVPPLGPTNITGVADVAGSIAANEDGSYTVGGIVDPGVESPVAMFTIEPTADPMTYVGGKIRLVQTGSDGTVTPLPEVDVDAGQITVDVGLLDNGTYMYYALVADAFGNWQMQGEDDMPSPVVTVHVLNIRVSDITGLTVTAVDGVMVDGELPERIPLRKSITVSFNVDNGSLAVGDLTGVVVGGHLREGDDYAAGGEANSFTLMANNLMEVADGWYTPHGRITKRNGYVDFPLAMINLDNTGPMIMIETPAEGATVNDLPTLSAGFQDGELGSGVSAGNTAVVTLVRIRPEEETQGEVAIDVDQSMVEQKLDSLVYTRTNKLAGGAYQFAIQVSDILGNVGEISTAFAVEGINPTVMITAPASGQMFDNSPAKITGFFAGGGEVSISKFTVNDADMTAEVDGNNFTYMLAETLAEGDHTVAVEVTDGSGLTAQTSLTFTVKLPVPTVSIDTPTAGQTYDHGKPIITGDFSGADPVEVVVSVDGEAVEAVVDDNAFTYTPADALSHGEHMVAVKATDANGRTAETSIVFTVDIPGPSVAIHSPAAGQMYDHGMPVISVESSGVAEPVTVSVTIDGEAATANEDGTYSPATALGDGEYTVAATATDANGKTAEATVIFSVGIPGPSVAIHSPAAGQMYDHGMPVISVESSGVAEPVTVSVTIDGEAATANEDGTYSPATALGDGEYTVAATATDANGKTAEATVIFSVGIPGPSVAIHSPAAGQMYDHGMPHASYFS
jgi:glycine cleavage system H lipoate-binding protein